MAAPPDDWLGDLRWQGYPRLEPVRDVASSPAASADAPPPRDRRGVEGRRLENVARENEALRAKVDALSKLASEFERRLAEAGEGYEAAALEADAARRALELERERLGAELDSARAELARREARDASRDAELALERERRADFEKRLGELARRQRELQEERDDAHAKAAELAGALAELRRQADASNERLLKAKALTDEDVRLLRQEMREFLAKFHRIQESFGENA